MSSVLRSTATPPILPTKFHRIESPIYDDSSLTRFMLFPFTYSNGVLDIQYIDSFEADMVTSTGNPPESEPSVSVQLMGGTSLVQSLGPNFLAYINAWRTGIDSGSQIKIYINGVVQKVKATYNNFVGDSVYQVTTTPPSSDDYSVGTTNDSFRTTWVFKKPLTITTVESGVTQYITFVTRFDED